MSKIMLIALSAFLGGLSPAVLHATTPLDIASPAAPATTPIVWTNGVVVRKSAQALTIRHEALTHLGMPAMTMSFQARDAAMLTDVNIGDKIRFEAKIVEGALTVATISHSTP